MVRAMAPNLAQIQALLYDLIVAPEGVAKRLSEIGLSESALGSLVKSTPHLSASERVDTYANMYFYRIRDVLQDEFPKVLAAIGCASFHNLVTDYLIARRPAHPSLREVGSRLADFLRSHRLSDSHPWLAELAQLERAQLELYDGPDAAALSPDGLRLLEPEALAALPVRTVPCHRFLYNRFSVSEIWESLEPAAERGAQSEQGETLLVWRHRFEVFHRKLDPDEEALVTLLESGATFGSVCEALLCLIPEEEVTARAFELLGRWTVEGLIQAPILVAAEDREREERGAAGIAVGGRGRPAALASKTGH